MIIINIANIFSDFAVSSALLLAVESSLDEELSLDELDSEPDSDSPSSEL